MDDRPGRPGRSTSFEERSPARSAEQGVLVLLVAVAAEVCEGAVLVLLVAVAAEVCEGAVLVLLVAVAAEVCEGAVLVLLVAVAAEGCEGAVLVLRVAVAAEVCEGAVLVLLLVIVTADLREETVDVRGRGSRGGARQEAHGAEGGGGRGDAVECKLLTHGSSPVSVGQGNAQDAEGWAGYRPSVALRGGGALVSPRFFPGRLTEIALGDVNGVNLPAAPPN